jgi:hypothetical protein
LANATAAAQGISTIEGKYPHFLVVECEELRASPVEHGVQGIDAGARRGFLEPTRPELEGRRESCRSDLAETGVLSEEGGSKAREAIDTTPETKEFSRAPESFSVSATTKDEFE